MPRLMYGTAWKEAETARLTRLALTQGFRAIDTANQRRHYFEAAVGEGYQAACKELGLAREEVFLQTKFTYRNGQDHRLPYDPNAPIPKQVEQSFASSLEHLGVDHLDGYLLHGPSTYPGLAQADWQAWGAMEDLQRAGKTRLIGISNVTAPQLEELWTKASVKPRLVQNRCFTRPDADRDVRSFCDKNGIAYEGFSLLTGNPLMVRDPTVHALSKARGKTIAQIVFRYCLEAGMIVLTGTTSAEHMVQDLQALEFSFTEEERTALDALTR